MKSAMFWNSSRNWKPKRKQRSQMKLYKYIGLSNFGYANCEAILRESKLWVSSYRKLNDPFEFRFASTNVSGKPDTGFAIAVKNSKNGVVSFSATNNDLLLWSHYANAHCGICFEFDSDKDEILRTARPVSYVPAMPTYDPAKPDEMLYSKSISWKYEDEVRVIVPDKCDAQIKVSKDSLCAVYFGHNVTFDDIARFDPLCTGRNKKTERFESSFRKSGRRRL